jgi:hypothetical protein
MAFTWNAVFVDEAHNDTKKNRKTRNLRSKKEDAAFTGRRYRKTGVK